MLSKLHRAAHKVDVNWAPLSNVMVAGTPVPLTFLALLNLLKGKSRP
jgi:hypothetical protein